MWEREKILVMMFSKGFIYRVIKSRDCAMNFHLIGKRCLSEIQTYFFYINLTQEIGCDTALEKEDSARCYIYQPIRMLQQYNNPSTGSKYFLKIRERVIHHGVTFADVDS